MLKAFKYRIYPNKEQRELLAKTFGSCRFVYNHYLDRKINTYQTEQKSMNYVECANDLKELKSELQWLKEVDAIALQQSIKDLDRAYQNFFQGCGFPRFKSKHDHFHSYRTQMVNNNIKVEKLLKRAQRQLSSKEKCSNNYKKAQLRVAKIHEKIANQRNDFLHKLSTEM